MDLPGVLEPRDLLREQAAMGEFGDPDELDPAGEDDDGQIPRRGGRSHDLASRLIVGRVLIDELDDRPGRTRALELVEELRHRRRGMAECRGGGQHELPAFEEALDVLGVGDVDPADRPVEARLSGKHHRPRGPDLLELEQSGNAQRCSGRLPHSVH